MSTQSKRSNQSSKRALSSDISLSLSNYRKSKVRKYPRGWQEKLHLTYSFKILWWLSKTLLKNMGLQEEMSKNKMQLMWWKWKETLPNIWVVKAELVREFLHLVNILGRKKDPKINDLYFHLWKLEGGGQIKFKVHRKKEKQEIN